MIRKVSLKSSKETYRRVKKVITPRYAVDNGMLGNLKSNHAKWCAINILNKYSQALLEKLMSNESYCIVFDDNYSVKKKVITMMMVRGKNDRLKVVLRTDNNNTVNKKKIQFKKSKKVFDKINKGVYALDKHKFPKE